MHRLARRFALLALAAGIAGAAVPAALAQPAGYPSRVVTLVVPFAAGGSVDTAARIVAERLGERLGQPVIVENAAGAAGTIGTQRAVRAAPDGYTLLFAVATPINVAPLVTPGAVRYDALADLQPVARVANSTFVLIGRTGLQAPDTAALVELARRQHGKLNYGTDGVGGSMHLAAELIKQRVGIDIVHVPYRSGPAVVADVAGGQIDLAVMPLALVQPFVKDGKVRAYGVLQNERWPSLPEVPSLAELPALKDLDDRSWYGVLAPARTDAAIVERLAAELQALAAEPAVARKLELAGLVPAPLAGAAFRELLQRERQTIAGVIAKAGIKTE